MTHEEYLQILPSYTGCMASVFSVQKGRHETIRLRVSNIARVTGQDYQDLKLILRPLSEIIGEDKSEYEHLYTLQVLSIHDDKIVQSSAKMINYLRSKGYDCDNLIESGFAITNTK